jgi:hypothetical protein
MDSQDAEKHEKPNLGFEEGSMLIGAQATIQMYNNDPRALYGVRLGDLRPDLFPSDRILAELILIRDRIEGVEHPELTQKLTAHW